MNSTSITSRLFFSFYFLVAFAAFSCTSNSTEMKPPAYTLVIHGGAGVITRESMSQEAEMAYRAAMDSALTIGQHILADGGTSLDAVEAVVAWMEDNPLFNAGKGAVFTYEGANELDASIMDGKNLMAGAVAGVKNVKHPVQLARRVMEHSDHVMLSGEGAQQFAVEQGLDMVDSSWFFTQRRWDAHLKALESEKTTPDQKHGTVGAVALDQFGNLAAATSTGGMTNKRWNRIGDTPVIGAGTYANNATCAASGTGHGEFFIRYAVTHAISAMMEFQKASLETAAHHIVMEQLVAGGGEGGVVAVDRMGNVAMPFNSEGMYRAYVTPDKRYVGIYKDE